jgi:uncharacterized protein YybS (DUF2232 family)
VGAQQMLNGSFLALIFFFCQTRQFALISNTVAWLILVISTLLSPFISWYRIEPGK